MVRNIFVFNLHVFSAHLYFQTCETLHAWNAYRTRVSLRMGGVALPTEAAMHHRAALAMPLLILWYIRYLRLQLGSSATIVDRCAIFTANLDSCQARTWAES